MCVWVWYIQKWTKEILHLLGEIQSKKKKLGDLGDFNHIKEKRNSSFCWDLAMSSILKVTNTVCFDFSLHMQLHLNNQLSVNRFSSNYAKWKI